MHEFSECTTVPGKIEPLEPLLNCSIRADIAKRTLPGLGVTSGTLCGLRQAARPRGAVSSNEDDLLLAVNLREAVGLRVPRRAIAPFVGRLDDTPIRIGPRGTEALDLLLVYASAIAAERRLQKPELRRRQFAHRVYACDSSRG